jgi:hypothetical protein
MPAPVKIQSRPSPEPFSDPVDPSPTDLSLFIGSSAACPATRRRVLEILEEALGELTTYQRLPATHARMPLRPMVS